MLAQAHIHDAQSAPRFFRARRAETSYSRALRSIAREIGRLVGGFDPKTDDPGKIESLLRNYARTLRPWAKATAARMLADVAKRDAMFWNELSSDMARNLRREIETMPTGEIFADLMAEQVELITSLPLEAAQRVHQLAIRNLLTSNRAGEIVKEIMRTGEVTENRARLIARTETARASSVLVQARAEHVGSDGYIWETSRDADVRPSHRKMQGRFVRWDRPPVLDLLKGHAGQLPNCRCWPRVVFPEED